MSNIYSVAEYINSVRRHFFRDIVSGDILFEDILSEDILSGDTLSGGLFSEHHSE